MSFDLEFKVLITEVTLVGLTLTYIEMYRIVVSFHIAFVGKSPIALFTLETFQAPMNILPVSGHIIHPTEGGTTFRTYAALLSLFFPLLMHHLDVLV